MAAFAGLTVAACGPIAAGGPCGHGGTPVMLSDAVDESSGVVVSPTRRGIFWTHNDAEPTLFAVDSSGRIQGTVRVAFPFRDWEDLAAAPCPDGGVCLFAADTGDNYEERPVVHLVRLPEPAAGDTVATAVDVFPMRLPDGPRDIESLIVLPDGRIFFVTKGRNHPATVYRYPGGLRPDTVTLEPVQTLSSGPLILPRMVTGGSAHPDGGLVALRTYQSLQFYRVQGDTLAAVDGGLVNLRTLNEPQGEAVGLGPDGLVVLTSEGGPGGGPGSLTVLRCHV